MSDSRAPHYRQPASTTDCALAGMAGRTRDSPSDGFACDTLPRILDVCGLLSSEDVQRAAGLDAACVRPRLARLADESSADTERQRRGGTYRRVDG